MFEFEFTPEYFEKNLKQEGFHKPSNQFTQGHSTVPSGEGMDVLRVKQSPDFWYTRVRTNSGSQKRIVIVTVPDILLRGRVIKNLLQIFACGYEMYLVTTDNLVAATTLELLEQNLYLVVAKNRQQVLDLCIQHHIPSQDIVIFNYLKAARLNARLYGDLQVEDKNYLLLDDFSYYTPEQFTRILQSIDDVPLTLYCGERLLLFNYHPYFKSLRHRFSQIEGLILREYGPDFTTFHDATEELEPTISTMGIETHRSFDQIKKIQENPLNFVQFTQTKQFYKIKKITKNIKHLGGNLKELVCFFQFSPEEFAHLTHLKISFSPEFYSNKKISFDKESFIKDVQLLLLFLQQHPQITTLSLDVEFLDYFCQIPPDALIDVNLKSTFQAITEVEIFSKWRIRNLGDVKANLYSRFDTNIINDTYRLLQFSFGDYINYFYKKNNSIEFQNFLLKLKDYRILQKLEVNQHNLLIIFLQHFSNLTSLNLKRIEFCVMQLAMVRNSLKFIKTLKGDLLYLRLFDQVDVKYLLHYIAFFNDECAGSVFKIVLGSPLHSYQNILKKLIYPSSRVIKNSDYFETIEWGVETRVLPQNPSFALEQKKLFDIIYQEYISREALHRQGKYVELLPKQDQATTTPLWLDANTEVDANKVLRATQYFVSKAFPSDAENVAYYRDQLIYDLNIPFRPSPSLFLVTLALQNMPLAELERIYLQYYHQNPNVFLYSRTYQGNGWHALGSLSPLENIFFISINLPQQKFKIVADSWLQLHWLELENTLGQPIDVSFILYRTRIPIIAQGANLDCFPQEVSQLIRLCYFNAGKLEHLPQNPNQMQLLQANFIQRKGACLPRSMSFLWQYQLQKFWEKYQIVAKIRLAQGVHACIEVFYRGTHAVVDLGGYPAKLEISQPVSKAAKHKEKNTLKIKSEIEQFEEKIKTNHFYLQQIILTPTTNPEELIAFLFRSKITKPIADFLCVFADQESIDLFNQALMRYQKRQGHRHLAIDKLAYACSLVPFFSEAGVWQADVESDALAQLRTLQTSDVLVINCNEFDSAFNSVFDRQRRLATVNIHAIRIGVILEQNLSKMREDFISRFAYKIENCSAVSWSKAFEEKVEELVCTDSNTLKLDLADGKQLQNLKGKIEVNGKMISFTPRMLTPAIKHLILVNANKNDREIYLFIAEIAINKEFYYFHRHYVLSPDFRVSFQTETYDFSPYSVHLAPNAASFEYIINFSTLGYFFNLVRVDASGIHEQPGIVARHANQEIRCLVTEPLEPKDFKQLWETAKTCQRSLTLEVLQQNFAPYGCKVLPPSSSASQNLAPKPLATSELKQLQQVSFIQTKDSDFTLAEIKQSGISIQYHHFHVQLATGASQLLHLIRVSKQDVHQALPDFEASSGMLLRYLDDPEATIIVHGQMASDFMKFYESLFAVQPYVPGNGDIRSIRARILLLQENPNVTCILTQPWVHQLTENYYWPLLEKQYPEQLTLLKPAYQRLTVDVPKINFSYIQWQQMLADFKQGRHRSNPFKPYLLLMKPTPEIIAAAHKKYILFPKTSTPKQRDDTYYLAKIKREFTDFPYAYLLGIYLEDAKRILEALRDEQQQQGKPTQLYWGMDQLERALKADDEKLKIVAIHELALSSAVDFEQLFDSNAHLILKQQLFLNPRVKLVFIGALNANQRLSFFGRRGHVVEVRQPSQQEELSKLAVKFYADVATLKLGYTQEQLKNQILEALLTKSQAFASKDIMQYWEMILIRTLCHLQKPQQLPNILKPEASSSKDIESPLIVALQLACYDELHHDTLGIYSEIKKHQFLQHDDNQFNFCVTESRREIVRLVELQFKIRDFCRQHPNLQLRAPSKLILEGGSGVGKTTLVVEWIKAYYPQELIIIAPGNIESILKQLTQAQGKIIVIDELNTYEPEIDIALCQLLVDHPTSFVIATQNPIDFPNRRKLTPEFLRGAQQVHCPDYPQEELTGLLRFFHPRLSSEQASTLVQEYIDINRYVKVKGLIPKTINDLIEMGRTLVEPPNEMTYSISSFTL